MRKLLIFIFVFSFSLISAINFRHLTTLEGLSQNDVNCIFQDSKGFMWIGTNDGLNRYDGYNFKIYRKTPRRDDGLTGNIIQSVTEDIEGNLWIGTNDNGVCKLDLMTDKFTSFSNTPENPNLLRSNRVTKIKADTHGNVWVMTSEGLNVIKVREGTVFTIPFKDVILKNNNVISINVKDIYQDKSGAVWVGTNYGIRRINPISFKVSEVYVKRLAPRGVAKILELGDELLVNTTKGVYSFDRESKIFKFILEYRRGTEIAVEKAGHLWIGSSDGLVQATLVSKKPLAFELGQVHKSGNESGNLSSHLISDIYKDNTGLIWFGTNGGGVNVYNPKHKLFKHYNKSREEGSISYNKIRSFHEDKFKGLWVGTDGGGLNYLKNTESGDYSRGFIQHDLNELSKSSRAYSIAEDTVNNYLWVGTGHPANLRVFNILTGKEVNTDKWALEFSKSVFSVIVDSDNCVWLGTYGDGLWRLTPDGKGGYKQDNFTYSSKSYSLSSNYIRSLMEDDEGNIWIGTVDGLSKIKQKHKYSDQPKIFTYKNIKDDPKSLSHNYILPLFQSADGHVWVGTMGGGLNCYRETKEGVAYFQSYTTEEGLPNNVIKGILQDDRKNLWISTNGGLTRFNVKNNKILNYDVDDGLQDYEFSELACLKRSNGEMIFGGVKGFNSFYPKEIGQDKSKSKVAFTRLAILNQNIKIGEEVRGRVLLEKDINETSELRLKYSENSFNIFYTGLNFAAPRKNKYKYMLEGFDEEWITTTSEARFAKYTNIKPGEYKLKVMASNRDGVWSQSSKDINITIIAPWWLSNYALTAYVFAIVILLIFFRKFSLIGVQQKSQLLMERFEKEKVEELSQMKLKFFTNISHEFRTPLTLIIGPIEKLIRDKSKMTEERMDKVHNIIHRNANVLLRLINQLMDFRKFEQGKMTLKAGEHNLTNFIKDIYASFEIYAEQKNIEFEISFTSKNILLWFDAEKLEKVIYNLLSNAFKFTPDGGKISLGVSEDEFMVYLAIEDTGIGMTKDMQTHIFERFYQANKIENKKYGSTGIGLAYTKGLVDMHKGTIAVSSEEEQGTKFLVSLLKGKEHFEVNELSNREAYQSVKEVVWVNPLQPNEKDANEDNENINQLKRSLLIVEDNNELRSFIKESLSDDYKVFEAQNGEEGLEMCRQENPDLIVSDVMMPKMDGFEMCKAIKNDVNVSHTPIILLTAKTSSEHRVKGYSLGADAYVSKPFDLEVLKVRIVNLLEKREHTKNNFNKKLEVSPTEIATTSMDEKFLAKILSIIETNINNSEFTVEELASEYGISKVILNRKLKALTGQTAKIFIRSIRIKRAAQLLTTGRYSVADVTYEVGFSDLKYFRTCFKTEIGLSPSDYKREHVKDTELEDENKDE